MNYNMLIVIDDILVLKGLENNIPWSKYSINIIGSAGDGEEAIKILEKKLYTL